MILVEKIFIQNHIFTKIAEQSNAQRSRRLRVVHVLSPRYFFTKITFFLNFWDSKLSILTKNSFNVNHPPWLALKSVTWSSAAFIIPTSRGQFHGRLEEVDLVVDSVP